MTTAVRLTFLVSALCCQVAFADTVEDFGERMSYFYLTPTRAAFDGLQEDADRFREQLEQNGADILVAVMIAKISQANNWPITEGALGVRAKEILEGKSPFARYVLDDSHMDPTKLDVWWVSFFATGDERSLENIFRYAGLELPKGDTARLLIIGAATWSFKSNCQQHKRVLEFARQKLKSPSIAKSQATLLRECIALAEAKSPGRPER